VMLKTHLLLQSIRGDETVNVNKPSPVSPQLIARSGQSVQFSVLTVCVLCLIVVPLPPGENPFAVNK
jgi:hypothetical protein